MKYFTAGAFIFFCDRLEPALGKNIQQAGYKIG
jgi:hypothetical protein